MIPRTALPDPFPVPAAVAAPMAAPVTSPATAPVAVVPVAVVPVAVVPVAVVVVPLAAGRDPALPAVLASLARSRGAGDVPVAPGALAVLLLAPDAGRAPAAGAVAPDYPFPVRVEVGPDDPGLAAQRAAGWAAALGAPGVPVLFAEAGRPVPPRWAHGVLATLRDGADVVRRRAGLRDRLRRSRPWPAALSGRAQWAMERWSDGRGEGWAAADSPWCRPGRAGLRAAVA